MNDLSTCTTVISTSNAHGILFGSASVPASEAAVKECLPIQVCFWVFNSPSLPFYTATFYSCFLTKISDLVQVQYNGQTFYAAAWKSAGTEFPEHFEDAVIYSCSNSASIIAGKFGS